MFVTLACSLLACVAAAHAGVACYPEGPLVPRPSHLSASPVFVEAMENLTSVYDDVVSESIQVTWPVENVSFSVAVVSLDQADASIPIWEYHQLATDNDRGTESLDRDSQWLIGSVTKVFTDYLMLVTGINIDVSVCEYLPQLANSSSTNPWQDITLRMLGSHLAGVTADYGFSEYYFLKDALASLGLPPLNDSAYPTCGVIGLNGGCNAQGVSQAHPVTAVMERPAYSNAAFNVIGLALQSFTGKNYTELLREYIGVQQAMTSTYPSPGDDERGVIPPGESSWGADYGLNAPAGGLVSTLSDLSRFSHGLLTDSLALTPTETKAWLKPLAFAEGPYTSVGMPWEILRLPDLTPEHPHPVSIYGKSGGAQSYRSQLSLVPEYGVAVIVLTAGSMRALPDILDSAVSAVLPAVDAVARDQAKHDYARTFKTRSCQVTREQESHRLVIEQDADSLILKSVTKSVEKENRTIEILDAVRYIWGLSLGEFTGSAVESTVRLFPTDIKTTKSLHGGSKPARGEVWRLWPDLNVSVPAGGSYLPGAGLLSGHECMTWSIGDWVHYGREPLDRIVFFRDETGDVVGLDVPFLRSGVLAAV